MNMVILMRIAQIGIPTLERDCLDSTEASLDATIGMAKVASLTASSANIDSRQVHTLATARQRFESTWFVA